GQASVPFLGRGLVGRGSAAHGGGDVGAPQAQAVAAVGARGLVGVAGAVEGAEEPVARAVAGEDPARPVPAVSSRCQPDDEERRRRVPEAGQRPGPVVLVAKGSPLLASYLLAPRDQPRALSALHDLGREPPERVHVLLPGRGPNPGLLPEAGSPA